MTNDPRTVPAALDRFVDQFADQTALITNDRSFTATELRDEVHRAAAALIALGVEHGDRVRDTDTDGVIARARAVVPDDVSGAAPGESGEVLLRGPNVMLGYLDDPEATAAAIDTDGWLHTGDIGVLDENGNLRITDRLKDMYICGGFNVYPAEIEQVLARLDGVADAAVIGVPDERLGEVGRAFLVTRPGANLDEESVIAYTREHLANFKAPRSVRFVDALPQQCGRQGGQTTTARVGLNWIWN